ncbi:MAG: hypothetical protein Kow0049_34910 [Stanieria sp.]
MSNSPLSYPESYSPEDIQQILQIALARKAECEELTRQQLWEIASELEIDTQSLQAAEQDWFERKAVQAKRQAFNLYRRSQFKQKLTKYLIINIFLVSFNIVIAGTITWSMYILLFWGLGIALNGWKAYQTQGEEYERAFQRWDFQNEVKRTFATFWERLQKSWQV